MTWVPHAIARQLEATPKFLRRRMMLYVVVPQVGMLVVMLVPMIGTGRSSMMMPALLAYGLLMAPWVATAVLWRRRFRRRLLAARGRLCWHCGYDLSTLPNDGVCPECGAAYIADILLESWVPFARVSRRELRGGIAITAPPRVCLRCGCDLAGPTVGVCTKCGASIGKEPTA